MVDYVHIFSPTMVMELKAAYTRLWLYTSAPNQGTNASQKFGMPNTDVSDQISGLATIDIVPMRAVGSSFTLGDDRFVPIFDVNNVFQEQGSLTWTRGTHNIKLGASMIRRQVNYYQNTFGLGYFRFTQTRASRSGKLPAGQSRRDPTAGESEASVLPLLGACIFMCRTTGTRSPG